MWRYFIKTDDHKIIEIKDASLETQLMELQRSGRAKTVFKGYDNGMFGCVFEKNEYTELIAMEQMAINVRTGFNIHPSVPIIIETDVIKATLPIDTPYGTTSVMVPICDQFLNAVEYDANALIQEAINDILMQQQQLQMVQDVAEEVRIRHIIEHPPMFNKNQGDGIDPSGGTKEDIDYDDWLS